MPRTTLARRLTAGVGLALALGMTTSAYAQAQGFTCPEGSGPVTLQTVDFASMPPAGWSLTNTTTNCVGPGQPGWVNTDPAARGNLTGGVGAFAIADSDACGSASIMNAELRSASYSFVGLTNATVIYNTDYNDLTSASDLANLDLSLDGGSNWTNLTSWNEDHRGPLQIVQPLTGADGEANVNIRWNYVDATWDWWWQVDEVEVVACSVDAEPRATFRVTKEFTDGREDEVEVTLTCNTGLPLEQSFTIEGGGDGVLFVVTELQGEDVFCEVTETGGPDGYTPIFNGGEGCAWEGVTSGQYVCEITNQADPAEFTVTKDWVVEGAVGHEVLEEAPVTIYCNNSITDGHYTDIKSYPYGYSTVLSGDGDSVTVEVDTSERSAECYAEEDIYQSGVETVNECGVRTIAAGGSSSCTITNTVFFEGIPTLSQYGMAIMALLMLGVGVVGLRRFV